MSHELRTPLNIIIGYGSLLRDGEFGNLNDEQVHVMRLLEQNAQQLLDLINATLDLSRLESGRLPIDLQDVDVAALVAEVEAELQPVADGKLSVTFAAALSPGLGALHTDPGKLKLILKNLIGNAFKYTDAGSITLRAEGDAGGVRFEVSDTGVGIAPEVLPHIFEPFRQGSSGLSRTHGGVGLGLYIVSRLLELLGGSISVSSTPGAGTTFCFQLPRRTNVNRARLVAPAAAAIATPVS
jgi:signal transduction histidine kinase